MVTVTSPTVSQFFNAETAKALDRAYQKRDIVRRRGHVRAALTAAPGERILDVGCGPGYYVRELLDEVGPTGSIMGVDSSPDMLAMARLRCEGHPNVAFSDGTANSLPVARPPSTPRSASR